MCILAGMDEPLPEDFDVEAYYKSLLLKVP
jgi:hypothetical protein